MRIVPRMGRVAERVLARFALFSQYSSILVRSSDAFLQKLHVTSGHPYQTQWPLSTSGPIHYSHP